MAWPLCWFIRGAYGPVKAKNRRVCRYQHDCRRLWPDRCRGVFNYNVFIALMFLSVAAIGIYTSVPSFLSMPANISTGAAAAAGLAVVSCIGNIGGFVAPYVVGLLKDVTNSNTSGLIFLSLCLLVTGLICIFTAPNSVKALFAHNWCYLQIIERQ